MDDLRCFYLRSDPFWTNLQLFFFTYTFCLLCTLAAVLGYLDGESELWYSTLVFVLAWIFEWLMRNLVLCQRPGWVYLEKDKLTLWYILGILRIEYLPDRFQVLPNQKDEFLRIKIKKRIVLFKVHPNIYHPIYEKPNTPNLIKIVKTDGKSSFQKGNQRDIRKWRKTVFNNFPLRMSAAIIIIALWNGLFALDFFVFQESSFTPMFGAFCGMRPDVSWMHSNERE